jgi:hypothetical protein
MRSFHTGTLWGPLETKDEAFDGREWQKAKCREMW